MDKLIVFLDFLDPKLLVMTWNEPQNLNRLNHLPRPDRNHHEATPLVLLPPWLAGNETFWMQREPKWQILLFALYVCFFMFISCLK